MARALVKSARFGSLRLTKTPRIIEAASYRARGQGALLLREDFLQQFRGAGRGIRSDQLLLLAHDVEEAVERLVGDVSVDVEDLRLREGNGVEPPQQRVVLLHHPGL